MPLNVTITATRTYQRRKIVNFTLNDVDAKKVAGMTEDQVRVMAEQIIATSGVTWVDVTDYVPLQTVVVKTA